MDWLTTWSGRVDLNHRPPAPEAGALNRTALRPVMDYIIQINNDKYKKKLRVTLNLPTDAAQQQTDKFQGIGQQVHATRLPRIYRANGYFSDFSACFPEPQNDF